MKLVRTSIWAINRIISSDKGMLVTTTLPGEFEHPVTSLIDTWVYHHLAANTISRMFQTMGWLHPSSSTLSTVLRNRCLRCASKTITYTVNSTTTFLRCDKMQTISATSVSRSKTSSKCFASNAIMDKWAAWMAACSISQPSHIGSNKCRMRTCLA